MKTNEYLNAEISLFSNCYKKVPSEKITVQDFISMIKSPQPETIEKIAENRKLSALGKEKNADAEKIKLTLPCVTPSGATTGKREKAMQEGRMVHSGMMQLDVDAKDIGDRDPIAVRDEIGKDEYVLAAFLSPSGGGVKALVCVPQCATEEQHKAAWESMSDYFRDTYDLKADTSTKDPARLCFMSWDPDCVVNLSAKELPITVKPREKKAEAPQMTNGSKYTLAGLAAMIEPIPRQEYGVWLELCSAAWNEFGEAATPILKAQWAEEKEGEYEEKYRHRLKEITLGTVIHHARKHGWSDRATADDFEDEEMPDAKDTRKNPKPTQAEYEADLLERLEAMRYDPSKPPPPDEVCMTFLGVPVGARGNVSVIGSKVKTGKTGTVTSAVGVAIRGACQAQGDTLGFQWVGDATGAILHFDTEQSPADHHACVERARKRSGIAEIDRLYSYPIGKFSMRERMDILRLKVKKLAEIGKIDTIVLDGGADFVKDVNSTEIACDVVAELMRIAQEFNCCIIVVIHENPGTDSGKTRGHFGSELARKGYANLRIDKDPNTDISTIYGNDNRHGSIPKQHGLCFAWDKLQSMHATLGIYSQIVGQAKENAKITKEREKWSEIYDFATDENGTKCVCPELSAEQAAKIIQDINETAKAPKADTIKKQMQRAENLGVLRKSGRGTWTMNTTGQTGQVWDREEMS